MFRTNCPFPGARCCYAANVGQGSRTTRRGEEIAAVLFGLALLAAGGAALFFIFTIAPVHSSADAVRSSVEVAPGPRDAKAVDEGRRLARALLVDGNLPALSIAVARDGALVWSEAFGWADVETRLPATASTRFRIGAVSKAFTAAAAGLLRDRGRLELDAPVQRHVAAYPEKAWPVTPRHLLGEVAGVHHLRDDHELMPGRHCANLGEALEVFRDEPLRFQPGTAYRFSIYGWVLLSAVVDGASGEGFAGFISREVFAPLGMVLTALETSDAVPSRTSLYFPRTATRPELGLQDAPDADYSCFAGAGAYLSTASDLARFGASMLTPGLVTEATLRDLLTPYRLDSGASAGRALGGAVGQASIAGMPAQMLNVRGTPIGGTVHLLMFPEQQLVIALLSNVSYATGMEPLGVALAASFTEEPRGD